MPGSTARTNILRIADCQFWAFSQFFHISGLTISVADIGYLCMSSFISVSVHELGHALAAARLRLMLF
ncbi:hypothetical protein H5410_002626 [Solanum commersonii]|uniref:Uncharacterized protein n=1 Tax=Solanum commersonii TaxID=4109 RepID=A0A9J6B2B9_SOLCO|nr:hypothetical protein H5410_002626 [Solanum commersonii]